MSGVITARRPAQTKTPVGGQSRRALWTDLSLALIMATGLTTAFFSPLRLTTSKADAPPVGRVLGASTAVPLTVPVTVYLEGQRWQYLAQPKSGWLVEVLSWVAAQQQSTFDYLSRGSSMYLHRFLNIADDVSGSWVVRVNGLPVTDLSQVNLQQGDEVVIERLRP